MEVKSKLGDYILGRKLGSGQYSKVREGIRENQTYAVKYMKKNINPTLIKTCLDLVSNEVKVMSTLNHPNIVRLYEYGDKGAIEKANGKIVPVLYLVLELITGGELFDYVAVSGRFSDNIARHYFHQLIEALEFMHKQGFAHRDIKAENLLLDSNFTLKLADFGFSAPITGKDGSGMLHTGKGTEGYMAPEILAHKSYSGEKVDLFAAGVLLFIMVAQHPPFRKAAPQDGFYKLFCQHNDLFWKKMSSGKPEDVFSAEFKELVNALLAFDPVTRPSIAAIKEYNWYKGPTVTPEELTLEFAQRNSKVKDGWKARAEEALVRKKMAKCGLGPHIIHGTRAIAEEEISEESSEEKELPIYKVFYLNEGSQLVQSKRYYLQ